MKLTRYKSSSPLSYTLGATLSYELLKTRPQLITRVFLRPNLPKVGPDLRQILNHFTQQHLGIIETTKIFNLLNTKANCLLITEFTKPISALSASENHLVLVNPSNTGNLGTIMRSMIGFDYCHLALIDHSVDPYHPKTLRASMGAFSHLQIQTFPNIETYRLAFPNHQLYSFMLNREALPLSKLLQQPLPQPHSLIFGNEASGLPTDFANFSTPIYIPQSSQIDSLNLSVATSITLYACSQQQKSE